MKNIVIYFLIIFLHTYSNAQEKIEFNSFRCNIHGNYVDEDVYAFSSTDEAKEIILAIVEVVGLKLNFEIRAANISNAQATIIDGQRYILYNEDYIDKIKLDSKNDWSATFILAHEIGHHLNGHTITGKGSSPPIELEADEFAGYVLYKLGATLEDALSWVNTIPKKGSKTHPPKSARHQAVIVGFKKAKSQDSKMDTENTQPSKIPSEGKPESQRFKVGDACFKVYSLAAEVIYNITIKSKTDSSLVFSLSLNGRNDSVCAYDLPIGVYNVSIQGNLGITKGNIEIKIIEGETFVKQLGKL